MSYAADLVVPIEMVGVGLASSSSAVLTFAKTSTPLNPANYDGDTVSYEFEIVASNADATIDPGIDVSLYDLTNTTVEATINVPKSTAVITRFRSAAFTPAAGNNTFQVRLGQSTGANNVKVFSARIIVTQIGATKTRVQVPLWNYDYATVSNSPTVVAEQTASTSYTQVIPAYYPRWKRDDAAWGAVASCDFEAIIETANGDGNHSAFATLYNVTDTAAVAASEVQTDSTTWVCVSANFSSDDNFDDGDTFDARIRQELSNNACINFACLYLNISDVSKGEIYWRTAQAKTAAGVGIDIVTARAKIDTDSYSTPVLYHESTCLEVTAAEEKLHLHEEGTSDSATSHAADLGNSALTVPTTKGIVRSASALTGVTSGDRVWARKDASTYNITVSSMWLVVAWTGEEAGGEYAATGGVLCDSSLAGSGTYVTPDKAGSGTVTSDAALVGAGAYVPPEKTGSGGVISDATLAGSGVYSGPGAFVGSGGVVCEGSFAGVASYVSPERTGSAAIAADAALAGAGAYVTPEKAGGGAVESDASLAGSGAYLSQERTGSGDVASDASLSAAGAYVSPVKTGSGAIAADASCAGSATYVSPEKTASGAVAADVSVAGTGAYVSAEKSGSGGVGSNASVAGSGDYLPLSREGTGAVASDAGLSGIGAYATPAKTGSGGVNADASLSGSGTSTAPGANAGSGAVVCDASLAGAGTYVSPTRAGSGGAVCDATLAGAASYTPPVKTATGGVASTAGLAAAGTYTPPLVTGSGGVNATAILSGTGLYTTEVPLRRPVGHLIYQSGQEALSWR